MKFKRISPEEMKRYAPFASDFYLETVATYLEAGGLFPGWLGRKRTLYVYDASLDPEDYFNSYREISFEDAVKEAKEVCEAFIQHMERKVSKMRRNSLDYARGVQELGRLNGDLLVFAMQNQQMKRVG